MNSYIRFGLSFALVSYFLACSPVGFNKLPPPKCHGSGEACEQVCEGNDCIDQFKNICRTVGDGLVDVLIVTDNSGSMSFEQAKMADKFGDFVKSLGDLDYQIAMITTDVSSNLSDTPDNPPRAINKNGALQDGTLIEFAPGLRIIRRNTPNKEQLFASAVVRQETLDCEANLRSSSPSATQCPTFDERGIFAANLALDRNEHGFLRPKAHLAIIFLADEDERSGWYLASANRPGFPLQNYDLPETLVSRFKQLYPAKTLTTHAIIVRPGDQACFNDQINQGGLTNSWGSYGYKYDELAKATGGVVGDICASNYTSQLQQIGYTIQEQVTDLPLVCRPIDDDFDIIATSSSGQQVPIQSEADFNGLKVNILTPLEPNTKVCLSYSCESLK